MKKTVTFTLEIDTAQKSFDVSMNYLGRNRNICCGTDDPANIAYGLRRIIISAARLAHNVDTCREFCLPLFNYEALHAQLEKVEFESDDLLD